MIVRYPLLSYLSLCCDAVDLRSFSPSLRNEYPGPLDTDEVKKSPDERNDEQRALRSTFCPPFSGSRGRLNVLESDAQGLPVRLCVCIWPSVSIYSVVSGLRGLPEGSDKCFNRLCAA